MSIEKVALRKEIKAAVKALSEEQKWKRSERVLASLERNKYFRSAQSVLMFWSLPDEVMTHDFVEKWSAEKHILLPVVVGDKLEVRRYEGKERLRLGSFDIQEPVGELVTDYDTIDLVVVPGVGFDVEGHRLGRGKGYYDRLLPQLKARRIGICFPEQFVPKVPSDPWDVNVKEIIID